MSTYRLYQESRNAAWRTLQHFSCAELPVSPTDIAEKLRISILPFPSSDQEPRLHTLANRNPQAICMSLRIDGIWNIFLRKDLSAEYTAFAVAHELGHIILHHTTCSPAPKIRAFTAWENEGDILDDPQEMEDYAADIFAVRLLAPACVLHEMHVDHPGEIARLCHLPRKAAALRGERMELLNRRDAFYADPLEKAVMRQFLPFIRANNAARRLSFSAAAAEDGPKPAIEQGTKEAPSVSPVKQTAAVTRSSDKREEAPAPRSDDTEETPILPRWFKPVCCLLAIAALVCLILARCGVFQSLRPSK